MSALCAAPPAGCSREAVRRVLAVERTSFFFFQCNWRKLEFRETLLPSPPPPPEGAGEGRGLSKQRGTVAGGRGRRGRGRAGCWRVIITVKSGCWVSFPAPPNGLPLLLPRQKIYMCAAISGGGRGGDGGVGEEGGAAANDGRRPSSFPQFSPLKF